jgi:hypothetical protein
LKHSGQLKTLALLVNFKKNKIKGRIGHASIYGCGCWIDENDKQKG